MIPIKKIVLRRAEGSTRSIEGPRTVRFMKDADMILRSWAFSAPRGAGYNKVDVLVEWEDGESWRGRYELAHDDIRHADLGGYIQGYFRFYGGLEKRKGSAKEIYEDAVSQAERSTRIPRDRYAKFLDTHEIL